MNFNGLGRNSVSCLKTLVTLNLGKLERDVIKFTSQIPVHKMKIIERNIVVTKDILIDVTSLKSFGRCKFGTYCEYMHMESNETKLKTEIEKLKAEKIHLKIENEEPVKNIINLSICYIPENVETIETATNSENILGKQPEDNEKPEESPEGI